MKKVLHQGDLIQKHLLKIAKFQAQENSFSHSDYCCFDALSSSYKTTKSEDEIFFVFANKDNDQDSGVFLNRTQTTDRECLEKHSNDDDLTVQKYEFVNFESNFTKHKFKFELVHKNVRSKIFGMKEIMIAEKSFLRKIDKYKFDMKLI